LESLAGLSSSSFDFQFWWTHNNWVPQ
jgi:hypothetical protein